MPAIIIYIMGVSGSGKTTVGLQLSGATGIPFFDADDFHSKANKDKMSAGQPLNDDDRKDWLLRINELAKEEAGRKGAIIACSALKKKYRSLLSDEITAPVHWVLLQGSYQQIIERMKARKGHFMPDSLLKSQFETLETPANAIAININNSPEKIVESILHQLNISS
jgi:gluconokinase